MNNANYNPFKNERKYQSTYDSSKNHQGNYLKTQNTYSYTEEQFPEIVANKKSTSHLDNSKNFIGAINSKINENKSEIIEPGWIQIFKNKETGVIEKKYGKKIGEQKNTSTDISHGLDINNQMITVIDKMVDNWTRYIQQYDELNGEGEYDLRFHYEPDYISLDEDDEEIEVEEEDVDNYSDYEYEYY